MVFNSLTFIVFFACVLALHAMPFGWKTKKVNLLLASYLFYAAWNPPFIVLLWISTVVDWYAAQKLVHAERPNARRAWMLLSVVANLGMLGYFKYGGFLLDNFQAAMAAIGVAYQPPGFDIVLPVGISFYTFATLSYTLDVYLRRAKPATQFPRLRAVRDVLPAPRRRADHAAHRAGAAVRHAAPRDRRRSCASAWR